MACCCWCAMENSLFMKARMCHNNQTRAALFSHESFFQYDFLLLHSTHSTSVRCVVVAQHRHSSGSKCEMIFIVNMWEMWRIAHRKQNASKHKTVGVRNDNFLSSVSLFFSSLSLTRLQLCRYVVSCHKQLGRKTTKLTTTTLVYHSICNEMEDENGWKLHWQTFFLFMLIVFFSF